MATNLDGFKRGLDKFLEAKAMAASPDGCVLSPVFEAICLGAPVAGEHGWDGAVAPCPALWAPGRWLVNHYVNRVLDYIDPWSDPASGFLLCS